MKKILCFCFSMMMFVGLGDVALGQNDTWEVNGEKVFLSGSQKVGIGTDAPRYPLQIKNPNSSDIYSGLLFFAADASSGRNSYQRIFGTRKSGLLIYAKAGVSGPQKTLIKMNNNGVNFHFTDGTNDPFDVAAKFVIRKDGRCIVGDYTNDLKNSVDGANADYKLFVEKGILTEEVKVTTVDDWADYVFTPTYYLTPLEEVEAHITTQGHLHKTISAKQVEEDGGIELGAITVDQQEKIEELFLHVIELNKEVKALQKENEELKGQLQELAK